MAFPKKSIVSLVFVCLFIFLCVGVWYYHDKIDYEYSKVLLASQKDIKTSSSSSLSKIHHVFIILEENKDWSTIYHNPNAPFMNNVLLPSGAYAQDYHNVPISMGPLHPSEPSYILLEAGKIAFPDHTFTTDNLPSVENSTSATHLTDLLDKSHLSWKAYQEDISGTNCPIVANGNYAPKHNPYVYFQDVTGNPPSVDSAYCKEHVRPMSELINDLATGSVPNYVFITPNQQNDMHDGTIQQADTWISQIVPHITQSSVFKKDGALFITWDEGEGSDTNNPIGMIVTSPFVKKGYTNSTAYSHASYVKTVEEIFNLNPLLGFAGDSQTKDLGNFFSFPK